MSHSEVFKLVSRSRSRSRFRSKAKVRGQRSRSISNFHTGIEWLMIALTSNQIVAPL